MITLKNNTLILVGVLLFSTFILRDYLHWQSLNFILGLPALFLIYQSKSSTVTPLRYLFLSLFFLIAACFIPLNTLYYFGAICTLLFLVESMGQGRGAVPFLAAALMSPLAQYFFNVFSFPIRLWLTQTAVTLLRVFDPGIAYSGNLIILKGQEFSVDMACMGLNLTVASLLTGILVLALFQYQSKKQLSFLGSSFFLLFVFVLNIVANLIRILMLVHFSIFPDQRMHDIIGLVCLLVYVFLPTWWMASLFFKKFGKEQKEVQKMIAPLRSHKKHLAAVLRSSHWWRISFLLVILVIAGWRVESNKNLLDPAESRKKGLAIFPGYKSSWVFSDVLQLETNQSLVYLKPIPEFFSAEHNPMICWKGSGYQMQAISTCQLAGIQCYKAVLVQGSKKLYTAWWFYNGKMTTTSQLDWRWASLKGSSHFYLVNLTTATEKELEPAVSDLLLNSGYRNLHINLMKHETPATGK